MKANIVTHAAMALVSATLAGDAMASSIYDGSWNLVFVTEKGKCDAAFGFDVNISNGVITHPNLVRFRGKVTRAGVVHASVTVADKYAAGSGKLTLSSGRGAWSGRSSDARCVGYWTAQRD
jgi:hypothetical protein